jgi:hypothetical protein
MKTLCKKFSRSFFLFKLVNFYINFIILGTHVNTIIKIFFELLQVLVQIVTINSLYYYYIKNIA